MSIIIKDSDYVTAWCNCINAYRTDFDTMFKVEGFLDTLLIVDGFFQSFKV